MTELLNGEGQDDDAVVRGGLLYMLARRVRTTKRRPRRVRGDMDKSAWREQLQSMRMLYENKNSQHWRNEIADSCPAFVLWRTLHSVLGGDCWAHCRRLCYVFQGQGGLGPCVHCQYAALLRPLQGHGDARYD